MSVLDDLSHQKTTLLKRRSALLKQLELCMAEAEEIDRKISVIESCELEYDLHNERTRFRVTLPKRQKKN